MSVISRRSFSTHAPPALFALGLIFTPICSAQADASGSDAGNGPAPASLAYWDNWTDPQGITHLTKCRMTAFHEGTIGPDSGSVMLGTFHEGSAAVTVRIQPPHWKGAWAETHHVQWIVPLTGIYSVRAMDGMSVELNPGDVLLSEDTSPAHHGSEPAGHFSSNVGNAAVTLQVLQFGETEPAHRPCRWE